MGTDADGIHRELSHEIIGAAMTVLNTLKPGLDEKLYENALVIELRKRGHRVDQQKSFPVFYDGQLIGRLIPDVIVDDLVIVDQRLRKLSVMPTSRRCWVTLRSAGSTWRSCSTLNMLGSNIKGL